MSVRYYTKTEGLHIHGACAYFVRRICNMHLDSIDLCCGGLFFVAESTSFGQGFPGACGFYIAWL